MTSSYKLKVLLCGAKGCGKRTLLKGFKGFERDYKLTVGVNILTKEVNLSNGFSIALSLWDLGDQERFKLIRPMFLKGGAGALLIFDLSRPDTWMVVKEWYKDIIKVAGQIPFVLIGNKYELLNDNDKKLNRDECRIWAEALDGFYVEISSGDHESIDRTLVSLSKLMVEKL